MTPPDIELTDEFLAALDALRSGRSVFLTGKAGTGKSTLIRLFLAETDRRVAVAAPTGIAALNVGGYTIHRFFGFRPNTSAEDVASGEYRPGRFAGVIKRLDTLIIDEASMVRADLLDAVGAALEAFGPRPGEPFGGVQIVLVGDLFQLPPVIADAEADFFQTRYPSPYFFSADRFDPEFFDSLHLTRVFRQAGDARLTEILNAIRSGTIGDDARAELNARTDPGFTPPSDEFWLTVATTNRIASARNARMLAALPGPEVEARALIRGETDPANAPTDTRLVYKVGAQVMMLVNDPSDRFVNGTLGRITAIGRDENGPWVRIEDREGNAFEVGPHSWETTRPRVEGGRLVHEVVGSFTQMPFRLAWAITIHKSQGQTLDHLVVDLTGGTFAYGQLYVALSRCTSMDGLVLTRDVLPRDLKTDQRVRRFLTGSGLTRPKGRAFIGICSAGKVGPRTRPRPVEIAVVDEDGHEVSTLVNPESDLYDSRSRYGIEAADVLAAPRLAEAWPALLSVLEGRVPVGVDVDETLGWIDFELKRNARVEQMPLGLDLPHSALTAQEHAGLDAPTALERARAARSIFARLAPSDPYATPFGAPDRAGYLLERGRGPEEIEVAGLIGPGDEERLRALALERAEVASAGADAASVLVDGARVCFTGTVLDAKGRYRDRSAMEELAASKGLRPVATVSKTRCDILVCAEVGSQSSKARKAAEFGKPIVLAADFLAWAGE